MDKILFLNVYEVEQEIVLIYKTGTRRTSTDDVLTKPGDTILISQGKVYFRAQDEQSDGYDPLKGQTYRELSVRTEFIVKNSPTFFKKLL